MTVRSIMHLDMDAFYAAIEQLDDPSLRGKAVLVGYDGPRGVVTTASYEARPYGCRSAQPMAVARRLCPHAIVVPVRFARYREVSARMFSILDDVSPCVEPLSIDEAFVDLTGTQRLHGPAEEVARQVKRRIHDELHLTASVGLAQNKFLAKLASDLDKPDGLTVIGRDDVDRVLPPLPVTKIWGIGPKTAARLEEMGVRTIGDLRAQPLDRLRRRLGDEAEHYLRLAHGVDDRSVTPDRDAKQISHEQTFGEDVIDPQVVRDVLLEQVEQVARRLRRHGLHAKSVTLKIRYGDFETITRSTTLREPTDATAELWRAAREVFDRWATAFQPVRLIGMAAGQFTSSPQEPLFVDPEHQKQKRVDAAADRIAAKFGQSKIKRGGAMP